MKIKNKRSFKWMSVLLSMVMLLTSVPLTAWAAPASDIPKEMLDNVYLDALAYTGYDVQAQMDDGTIYKKYTGSVPASIRSNIGYGLGPTGTETRADSSTVSGRAPDIARFESGGLCCASYISYVYFNYLPNVAGIDTSGLPRPTNLRSAVAYNTAANSWVASGKGRRISFTQNSDGSNFVPAEPIPIGSLIVFKHIPTGAVAHVAIYAGYYNGQHFVTHVGNERGPEFCTIVGMSKGDYPEAVVQVVVPDILEESGKIQVQKNDTDGKGLSGAYFVATSVTDSNLQYTIGPTNDSGFAESKDEIPYGQYRIYESVFPENYRAYGQKEWYVTVGAENDGVAKFNAVNELIPGSVKIVKESEDGNISGKEFHISGNGIDRDVVSGSDGTITIPELKPGVYTVSEREYPGYVPQDPQTVTVVSGETAIVTFNNLLRRGDLTVTKTAEDGLVEGKEFRLFGTSDTGQPVNMYAVSDSTGKAYFKAVPIGTYTLSEENVEAKYVIPEDQTVEIFWKDTTQASFDNILKKWRADIYKLDSELSEDKEEKPKSLSDGNFERSEELAYPYGHSQGDASLQGAVYGVYQNGELLETYTTSEDGHILTDWFVCGSGYTIQEISSSTGYLLDDTVYYPYTYADGYTNEFNIVCLDVYETIKKGNIVLVKHSDDGSTQIENPEEGAQFHVYLKSSGSYEAAKETERDSITIDKNGFGVSKDLPYGLYVVEQVSGKEDAEMMEPFEVMIEEHAEIYSFIINNAPVTALIDIVKKDATTGKIIPAAGVGFKIKDMATGEFIRQTVNYPTPMELDIFYTNEAGTLRLPEALAYGDYQLIEVTVGGAEGYVLDSTPVPFTVDGTKKVITVEKHNEPQMGTVTIEKRGEIFASVSEQDGVYTPVYKEQGLEGAVFNIYAVEDTYTLDGSLRYEEGEKIATLTTGADGTAVSEPIYLAKLKIVEEKAPYGMVLLKEPLYAELTYAGEEVKLTTTAVSAFNERQKVGISLLKALEKDETYGIGLGEEYANIRFGLFMAESLKAADGTELPKDGLLESVGIDENGMAFFTVDVPVGAKLYVKEIATDEKYLLGDTIYPVEFQYGDPGLAVVQLVVNNGEIIDNTIIRGRLEGIKTDSDGGLVSGAVFGLFKPDETDFILENALVTTESGDDGRFVIEGIPYGQWKLKELSCPAHLVPSDEVYDISITEQDQVVSIAVENKFVTGAVRVIKLNAKNTDEKLSGCVFEIYCDVNGNGVFDAGIDTLCGEMDETGNGVYEMNGLRYGGYLLLESKTIDGFIRDENYYSFHIEKDGETVEVENKEGVGFVNEPIPESPEVPKTGDDSNMGLWLTLSCGSLFLLLATGILSRRKHKSL